MSDELLSGFASDERALLLNVLKREDEVRAGGNRRQATRKPTDAELIAAGWKSPPSPPPTEAELLSELREVMRTEGYRAWTMFGLKEDEVLHKLHKREPGLLRHRVTKSYGDMWRIADTTPAG